jgi:hypothetical protein
VASVEAAARSPRTLPAHKPRLTALLPFLRRATVEAQAREALDALDTARLQSTLSAAGVREPLATAWAAVAEEADTARRAALAQATAAAELALLGPVQRRWEAVHAASRALGLGASPAPEGLTAQAVDFLKQTEDGFRDVLGYGCRKLDAELRPLPSGDAGLQEFLRLRHSPLPSAFPEAQQLPSVRQWLDVSGLTLEATGRVRLHRPGGPALPEAACFALAVPQHLLLVLPAKGRGSFAGLLDAAGEARALASVSAGASLAERRLGDASVRASAGGLFQGVLTSAAWLRRFFSLGKAPAREVARLSALVRLGELRAAAARLPWVQTLEDVGPSLPGLQALATAMQEALFLRVPEGAALGAFAGWPPEVEALQAAALAECLQAFADERFDAEDFRNPSAARWLDSVWARGAALDADALAKEYGQELSLLAVGRRLLRALGA